MCERYSNHFFLERCFGLGYQSISRSFCSLARPLRLQTTTMVSGVEDGCCCFPAQDPIDRSTDPCDDLSLPEKQPHHHHLKKMADRPPMSKYERSTPSFSPIQRRPVLHAAGGILVAELLSVYFRFTFPVPVTPPREGEALMVSRHAEKTRILVQSSMLLLLRFDYVSCLLRSTRDGREDSMSMPTRRADSLFFRRL